MLHSVNTLAYAFLSLFTEQIIHIPQLFTMDLFSMQQQADWSTMADTSKNCHKFSIHLNFVVWKTSSCRHPSVTHPVKPYPMTFLCLPGTHCNTKFDPTNISLPQQLIWLPRCPMADHWFERQSGVNSHRRNLEIVRIQLVKPGGARILSSAEPFVCLFATFAT